jgi:hypothetical protein
MIVLAGILTVLTVYVTLTAVMAVMSIRGLWLLFEVTRQLMSNQSIVLVTITGLHYGTDRVAWTSPWTFRLQRVHAQEKPIGKECGMYLRGRVFQWSVGLY